jgi:multiple sugar transport system ATP-binding protein
MSALSLRGIGKSFGGVQALADVDLDVREGEFVVLVGPSGCGKSTLLRIIAGLERPSAGEILLDGRRVNDVAAADRGLAMVFQSYALYPHMSVRENLAFGLENTRTPRREIEARIAEAARMLRIEELMRRKPRQLSGGQRQRVAIGRALVRRPGLFLLDEPLSNLDAELRVAMRAELAALRERIAGTMIYVTHDQIEAMTLADRIVVLNKGRVEQIGAPLDLYNEPQTLFVAGFIGSPRMNFLSAELRPLASGEMQATLSGGGAVPVSAAGEAIAAGGVMVGFRPQEAALGDTGLPIVVRQVERLGSETIAHCRTAADESVLVAWHGQAPVAVGEALHIDLAATPLSLFADGRRVAAAIASTRREGASSHSGGSVPGTARR